MTTETTTEPASPGETVKRRCIFFIGGYDPKTSEAFFKRMQREMKRFEATWGVSACSRTEASGETIGRASVTAASEAGWRTETEFNFLVLDDIVRGDFAKPLPWRVLRYLVAFFDYVFSGTAFTMFARSWRFGLYYLYPFAVFSAFCAVALGVAIGIAGFGGLWALTAAPIAGLLVLWGLMRTLGARWSVPHLMDLWSFSLNFLRGRRPDADALLDGFADAIVARAKAERFDEILLIGHSTGGGLILDITGRCLKRDPDFAGRAPEICILTLGSTALKLGLHPAARDFRAKVQSLVDEPRLNWAEYQCLTDVINFYRTDPVVDMKLSPRPEREGKQAFPMIRSVRMRDCLDRPTYKRIKRNFFRVHYQFVYGNTRRYFYDFFMICFGPYALSHYFWTAQSDERFLEGKDQ